MANAEREMTPVIYNAAALKLLHFEKMQTGEECFRMHWHERMELLRIRSGSLLVELGSRQLEAGAGSLVLFHPEQPHRGVSACVPLIYDVVMFDVRSLFNDTDMSRAYLEPVFDGSIRFQPVTACREILDCADDIICSDMEGMQAIAGAAKLYRLFYLLYRSCLCEPYAPHPFHGVVRESVAYIREHYASAISTEELCTHFGYAKSYFCRKFRECTGLAPVEYLNIFRVETAYRLLRSGEREISEVAYACGFRDANYFTRCFRKHFGFPPSHCRKSRGKLPSATEESPVFAVQRNFRDSPPD